MNIIHIDATNANVDITIQDNTNTIYAIEHKENTTINTTNTTRLKDIELFINKEYEGSFYTFENAQQYLFELQIHEYEREQKLIKKGRKLRNKIKTASIEKYANGKNKILMEGMY